MRLYVSGLTFGLLIGLTSCLYRMPTDDDITSVPITNNPRITGDRGMSMPGGTY